MNLLENMGRIINDVKYVVAITLMMNVLTACDYSSPNKDSKLGWQMVYQHDENGTSLKGSINSLIAGIRNGYDVRVGWGWEKELGDSLVKIEHMADPIFLTIIQEKDVSVIIDAHPLLQSYIKIDSQSLDDSGDLWQCVLTTQGTFNAKVYSRTTGELIKDWPQRHRISWFLQYPGINH